MKFLRFSTEKNPPPYCSDLDAEAAHGGFVRDMITAKTINAAHDISDGGLLCAVADMLVAGAVGADISMPEAATDSTITGWAFGEDQGRYVIATDDLDGLKAAATAKGVAIQHIGRTNASRELKLSSGELISVKEIRDVYENWLPAMMAGQE